MATFTITASQRKYNFPEERSLSMVIYKITNNINGKLYIGQSKGVVGIRWRSHCNKSGSGVNAIKEAIKKYGYINFTFSVITTGSSIDELNLLEAKYIKLHNSIAPHGYNLHSGGNNHIASEISRKNMSKAACARWGVNKSKAQIILDMSSKEKLQKKLDRYHRMSITKTGVPSSKRGTHLSIGSIEKIRKSKTGVEISKKWKQIIDNDGHIYVSIKHAVVEIGCNRATLMKHLNGTLKTVYNKTYSYLGVPIL